MSLGESLLVSGFSMALVFSVLVVLYLIIEVFSKILGNIKSSPEQGSVPAVDTPVQPVTLVSSSPGLDMSVGKLQLKKVDEKTAAMIMAIVSDESGIPLSELRFKSIKLLEENN